MLYLKNYIYLTFHTCESSIFVYLRARNLGFSCNKLLLSLSFTYARANLRLLYFKAENFRGMKNFAVDIEKRRTQNVKKISEPNIEILQFFRYSFVIYTFAFCHKLLFSLILHTQEPNYFYFI